jgi:hypothetical protein
MKGVFCLEGYWYGDHRDKTSVFPVLDLIHRYNQMPFIYHRCATPEEFVFSINRWKTKSFHKKYPLLYLAFHGEPGIIKVGKTIITLDDLANLLQDKCEGVVIHFGCCSTMYTDRRLLQSFMEKTRSVALMGYKEEVDWLPSTSFEIMLLNSLSNHPFDSKGVKQIYDEVMDECKGQAKKLDFRFVPNERLHFPRRRK